MTILLLAAVLAAGAVGLLLLFTVVPDDGRLGVSLAVAIALLFIGSMRNAPEGIRDIVLISATALVVVTALLTPRPQHRRAGPILSLLAFFSVYVLVTLAQVPEARSLVLRISIVSLAFAFAATRCRARDLRVLLGGLIVLALVESVLGVAEFFVTGTPIPWGHRLNADGSYFDDTNKILGGGNMRVQGTTEHPIPYAVVLVMGALALSARWSSLVAPVRLGAAGLMGLGLVLSGTRSALVALALGLVFLIFTSDRSTRALRIVTTILASLVAVFAFFPVISGALHTLIDSGSYENRASAIASVPGLLGQSARFVLFGHGAGSEPSLYLVGLLPQNGFENIDNQLVTSLATTGLVGVGLLVTVFLTGFRSAGRAARALILAMATMLFSFDYVAWSSMSALLAVVICLPRLGAEATDEVPDVITEQQAQPIPPRLEPIVR